MKWETTNIRITERILFSLDPKMDVERKSICQYVLLCLLSEVQKIAILLFLFSMIGQGRQFLIITLIMLTLRVFMGGTHKRTNIGCLSYSIFSVLVILLLSRVQYSMLMITLIGLIFIFVILLCVPVKNRYRMSYTKRERNAFKIKSLAIGCIWFALALLIPSIQSLIFSSLLYLEMDIGISCIC